MTIKLRAVEFANLEIGLAVKAVGIKFREHDAVLRDSHSILASKDRLRTHIRDFVLYIKSGIASP